MLVADALVGGESLAGTLEVLGGGVADAPSQFLVERIGIGGADVIGFEDFIDHLNSSLTGATSERKPQPLSADQRAALKSQYGLSDAEVAEVARPEFTPLDAYYLDETVLCRDIARALDVGGLKPVEKARAALNWVVVNLRPLDIPGPATQVLARAAKEAGCSVVLPRSKFVEELPRALPEWLGAETDAG